MYLDHFGLREAPFRITPHTEFFFSGANRGATLEALIYAITQDEGIVKVSGEVGSGKTMLCRMLLEKLPENVETVYLANPSLSRAEILHAIAEELNAPLPEGRSHQLQRLLQDKLLEIYTANRLVVVMIDEAHAMPAETLEEIRLLSNLESNRHKLLHIVLFGQPELDEHLSAMNMRQLKERITHNFALEPLLRNDIGSYLMFRMRAAGYHGPDLFTAHAIQLISKASEGLTRRVNILADKALLAAFSENKHQIDVKQVKAAIGDVQFSTMHNSSAKPVKWVATAAIVALIAVAAYLAGNYAQSRATAPDIAPTARATSVPSPEPFPAPAKNPGATAPEAAAPNPPPAAPANSVPTLDERIAESAEWLKTTPDSHFFIQLLSTEAVSLRDVELFLEESSKHLDASKIRVYRSKLSGHDRIGVIYGDYPSQESAAAELAAVSKASPTSKPYIRSVRKLR